MHDLRLELRTRNNRLWHVIFDHWPSVAAFCRAHELTQTDVGELLNLTESPYSEKGTLRRTAQRLVDIAQLLAEDLFPKALYSGVIPQRMTAEIPSTAYRGLTAARHVALPPHQDAEVVSGEIREGVNAVLETLTPSERYVIQQRFGLNEAHEEQTHKAIGEKLQVSTAYVWQIEKRALKRLQRGARRNKLRPLVAALEQSA